jgi:hypothetical protein
MRANVHDCPSANMVAECAARHLGRETGLGMEETGYDDGFNSDHWEGSLASAGPCALLPGLAIVVTVGATRRKSCLGPSAFW